MELRRFGLALVLVGSAAAATSCKKSTPPAAPAPPAVMVTEVRTRDVPIYFELVGTVTGMVNAEIRARVAGYVRSQDYRDGATVKAGQLLFTLDPQLVEAALTRASGDLAVAKANLAKTTLDVTRVKKLVNSGALPQQNLDDALAAQKAATGTVETAQGALATARTNVTYARVLSPIDGVAGIAKANVGSLVGQGEPTLLTTVSQIEPVRVNFAISEKSYIRYADRIRQIQEGSGTADDSIDLILADGSTYPHHGRITFLERQVDPTTGTITLQAVFPNPEGLLRPGQYGKVRGIREMHNGAVVIPQRAVAEVQGASQVVVIDANDKAEIRTVTVGDRAPPDWIIEKGVKPGERVVVEGLQMVKAGMKVTPRPAPAEAVPTGT